MEGYIWPLKSVSHLWDPHHSPQGHLVLLHQGRHILERTGWDVWLESKNHWVVVACINFKIKGSQPASSSIHFREVHLLKVNLGIKRTRLEHSPLADMKQCMSTLAPIWSKTSWVESMISGPTPSPGINVTGTLPDKRPR